MDEINPLSEFLSPLISFICGEDTVSVSGIVYGTIWGSLPVLGSFAVQFGDHLRYGDHLRAGIICGHAPSHPYTAAQVNGPFSHVLINKASLNPVFGNFQRSLEANFHFTVSHLYICPMFT